MLFLAETISEDADLRKALRTVMFDEGIITREAFELSKFQIAYSALNSSSNVIHVDGTTRNGKRYLTCELGTSGGTLHLGIRQVVSG